MSYCGGVLYTNVIGEILEKYIPTDDKEIHIFCDQRSLKGMTKRQFESAIFGRLLPLCASDARVQVEMIDSAKNANIQIADWISGALARYLEKGHLGDDFYKILKNNLLDSGKEFFSN